VVVRLLQNLPSLELSLVLACGGHCFWRQQWLAAAHGQKMRKGLLPLLLLLPLPMLPLLLLPLLLL
jgi:hypothetical protein